ncbi:MAG TPA: hypothetical protein VNH65_07890 [Candidatus Acidoferrum sp.]|nr:hypothetical protein [Candidatus Acidoferrum sp.]
MAIRMRVLLSLVLLFACFAAANKKKDSLPAEVLDARTVVVLIDPAAGVSTSAPLANKTAQEDVEKALASWGRLKPIFIGNTADLIIIVRKGNGKIVQPTVGGEPPNDRPVVVQPRDTGVHIGVQQGRPPDSMQAPPQQTSPSLGSEIGPTEDTFLVYMGGTGSSPLERAPVWRYVAKNGLHSPDVPAVREFRKAIEAALKQRKSKP